MLIEKVFHLKTNLEEAKSRLSKIRHYRRHLDGVEAANVSADGVGNFRFDIGLGIHASLELTELANDSRDVKLFRSTGGDLDMVGSLEFVPIKPKLTEVVLTLDYRYKSMVSQMVDQCTGMTDSFLNRQLRRLETHLDGSGLMASGSDWRSYQRPVQYA
jgi:hypothetical protein